MSPVTTRITSRSGLTLPNATVNEANALSVPAKLAASTTNCTLPSLIYFFLLLSTAEGKFWLDVFATVSFTRVVQILTPIRIAHFAEITEHIYPILGHVCAEMGHLGKSRKLECSMKQGCSKVGKPLQSRIA